MALLYGSKMNTEVMTLLNRSKILLRIQSPIITTVVLRAINPGGRAGDNCRSIAVTGGQGQSRPHRAGHVAAARTTVAAVVSTPTCNCKRASWMWTAGRTGLVSPSAPAVILSGRSPIQFFPVSFSPLHDESRCMRALPGDAGVRRRGACGCPDPGLGRSSS